MTAKHLQLPFERAKVFIISNLPIANNNIGLARQNRRVGAQCTC